LKEADRIRRISTATGVLEGSSDGGNEDAGETKETRVWGGPRAGGSGRAPGLANGGGAQVCRRPRAAGAIGEVRCSVEAAGCFANQIFFTATE